VSEKKSHAWNAYQAEQAAMLRKQVENYVLFRGLNGCGIHEVMAVLAISYNRAQYALIELRKAGVIELNGLRAQDLRWGPPGIKAHYDTLMEPRRAKAAENRRERNRRYQAIREQTRVRKDGKRKVSKDAPLSSPARLVQRVPCSVWDLAKL
jgi:hypothetical protein